MNREKFMELAKEAEKMAEAVSESYRPLLFARALEELIKDESCLNEDVSTKKLKPSAKPDERISSPDRLKAILDSHLDINEDRQILEKVGSLERSLLVMELADRKFGLSELTPPEIATILSQNLGIATTPNAVSMALKKTTNLYVRRRSEAKGFAYLLTPAGRDYLKTALEKAKKGQEI